MKMFKLSTLAATVVVCAALVYSTAARAGTVNFTFYNGTTAVADGSFSWSHVYDPARLSWSELNSWYFHFYWDNKTYDLNQMLAAQHKMWQFNTITMDFNQFDAVKIYAYDDLTGPRTNGWLVYGDPSITDYSNNTAQNYTLFVASSPSGVPLPAALPLFATGAGLIGLLGWRRKRKAQAALAGA